MTLLLPEQELALILNMMLMWPTLHQSQLTQ